MMKQSTAQAAQPATDLRQRAARARDAAGRFIKHADLVEATSPTTEIDPVFALIEEHRAAYAKWNRLSAIWNDMLVDAPGYHEAVAASEEPGRREIAAYNALFLARPASLAGTAVLASYLGEAIRRTRIDAESSDGERALGTVAAALQPLAVRYGEWSVLSFDHTHRNLHPDAALFALGDQFMAAWVAEDAVEVAESRDNVDDETTDWKAYNDCNRIAVQIVRTPAVTTAGYGIKALLLARYDSEDSGPSRPIAAQGAFASDWNVLRQVQQGAARLAATPDIGMPMSAPAAPVTGIPVLGGLAEGRLLAPDHDLSELSIAELAHLYPVVVRAEEALGGAENAPCFWIDQSAVLTPAGRVVNREADRLSQFISVIAKEMGRRQPADEDEAEARATTLLSHMVLTGGVAEHPELIAEINVTWGA